MIAPAVTAFVGCIVCFFLGAAAGWTEAMRRVERKKIDGK